MSEPASKGGKLAPSEGAVAKKDSSDEAPQKSRLSWALGWVALPGAVLGGIFGGGVLVGANFHESWFTRAFVWIFS
ncbi:MAG: hypothetical protein ACE37F_34385 [Nannocystaceae bacterium]|nr:hypothetical protein [bacterium]